MALFPCPECQKEISDTATSCPSCGAPIGSESSAAGAALTTTQETSKKLKAYLIISSVLFWLGLTGSIFVAQSQSTAYPIETKFWYYALFAGIALYLYTKFKIWWHHK